MFVVAKQFSERPKLVGKTGIQIHHLHYGVVLVLLAVIAELFLGKNYWTIIFQGLGLGLILDEFISSLMLPEHRSIGLALYRRSFKGTLLLFLFLTFVLLTGAALYLQR